MCFSPFKYLSCSCAINVGGGSIICIKKRIKNSQFIGFKAFAELFQILHLPFLYLCSLVPTQSCLYYVLVDQHPLTFPSSISLPFFPVIFSFLPFSALASQFNSAFYLFSLLPSMKQVPAVFTC